MKNIPAKKVLGVIGRIGAGKDTVAEYVAKKYGYDIVSFRDAVREVTEKEGLKPNRENMQKTGKKYREKYGSEYFTKLVMDKVMHSKNDKIIVKEMRTEGDVKLIKENFGKNMKIIQITAPKQIRFERIKARGRLGDPKTMEEFGAQEQREEELGYTKALEFTEHEIENNGTFRKLYKKIDSLLRRIDFL